jgi:hypothetical protein
VSPARAGPRVRACLARFAPLRVPRGSRLVERTGLASVSLTLRVGIWVYGCDGVFSTDRAARWCGQSVGRLDRPLFDPRLNVLCRDRGGRTLGSAWIHALPGARYVVVLDKGYTEAYDVMAHMPVRVTTHDVDLAAASATFRVEQYAADGSRLVRETLRARVAG